MFTGITAGSKGSPTNHTQTKCVFCERVSLKIKISTFKHYITFNKLLNVVDHGLGIWSHLDPWLGEVLAKARPSRHASASKFEGSYTPCTTIAEAPMYTPCSGIQMVAVAPLLPLLLRPTSTLFLSQPDSGGSHLSAACTCLGWVALGVLTVLS